MGDYSPNREPGRNVPMTASAAITGGQLVRISGSGTVAPTTAASADWFGVAMADAASGTPVTICSGGVQYPLASGSITAGQNVEGAAAGAVAAHTNGTNDVNIVGIALDTVTTGNRLRVQFVRG